MPYVEDTKKPMVVLDVAEDAGQLNYQLTRVIVSHLRGRGLTYQTINDVVGALEGAKAEFQRRVVAPYEDDCIAKNGDVYPIGLTSGRPNKGLTNHARL